MNPKQLLGLALVLSGGLFGGVTKPDAVDLFVANLSADHGLWVNGFDADHVSQAVSPEEVVTETFQVVEFENGWVTSSVASHRR